ncbi:MAG: hypothetical protein J6C30_09440 [Lentisphaeria bacterium]|nr:hypothetical protein [Lentisphaeria bacterium]
MKIFLTGRHLETLAAELVELGFTVTKNATEADLVLSHGGDGAMLGAEYACPGKLKFALRDMETAPLCPLHQRKDQLLSLKNGQLKVTELPKVTAICNGQALSGINDVFIHNSNYVSAMRYKVWIDGELYGREIVGDGVGLSTVHGATAYYRSITHSIFRTGIGLAFSNSTEVVNHLVLPESSVIRVQILRGPCEVVADNAPKKIQVLAGDEVELRLSSKTTSVLGLENFMCPACCELRHSLRNSTQNG